MMPAMRCYFLNYEGHFVGSEEIEAATADDAARLARQRLDGETWRGLAFAFEIWSGVKFLRGRSETRAPWPRAMR